MRRLSSSISLLPLLWALLPACSQKNTDHCGNLDGHATCSQQSAATPFCSICVADNNGCVADRPDDACFAATAPATSTAPASSSSTLDPTGTESATSTTNGPTATGPTTDPTTGTTTTGQTDTSTTPGTTTTGDPGTTSTDTSTSTSDTVDTLDTLETLGTSTTGETDTTAGTTMEPDPCGNNMIDGDEVCDGTNNNGQTCIKLLPSKWGGGKLACNKGCASYDDTECCIGTGQKCNYLTEPDEKCCPGLSCQLGTCKN